MKTISERLYEAMFLVDSSLAASDWDGIQKSITNILQRSEAEIVSLRKWDERRLAYEIRGKSRGTYLLCFFRADGRRIRDIERDVQLSEQIMRVLVLCAEGRESDAEKESGVVVGSQRVQEGGGAEQADAEKEAPVVLADRRSEAGGGAEQADEGEKRADSEPSEEESESESSEAPVESETGDEAVDEGAEEKVRE